MQDNAEKIIKILKKMYPNADCGLDYKTDFQLLVDTILSAQTTDVKVNEVTKKLFKKYPDLNSFLSLKIEDLQNEIKQIGLYKNKSKYIINMCNVLKNKFNGKVPSNIQSLTKLPGVGRKTANVILANIYKEPAIAVDTHVKRVSNRLELSTSTNPEKIESDLKTKLDKGYWIDYHNTAIWHGRTLCKAKNPLCDDCKLKEFCCYYLRKDVKNGK